MNNPLIDFWSSIKRMLLGSNETLPPLVYLSSKLSFPMAELQQLLSFKAGFPLLLKELDAKTISVEKRVGGRFIGHTFRVSFKVASIQGNTLHVSLSGSDLILSRISAIKHPALSFNDDRTLLVKLEEVEQLKPVLDKVTLVNVGFIHNFVVVDVKIKT